MNLTRRIDKLEAATIARVQAERKAAVDALGDWITANTSPSECDAYWRFELAEMFEMARARRDAGLPPYGANDVDEAMLDALRVQLGEPQANDAEIHAALEARIPPEMVARCGGLHHALASRMMTDD